MIALAIYLVVFFGAAALLIVLLPRAVVEENARYTVGLDETTLPGREAPERPFYKKAA